MYYFASDVHLGAGDELTARRTEQHFVEWLDKVSADAEAIFLVGDIFDFWYEYEGVVPKGFARTIGKLAELTDRGIKIYFFIGNHDMWCRDYLHTECGVEIVRHPQKMTLYGREVFIAHGDNMNIQGKPLLRLMNWSFRSEVIRTIFSWVVHPDLAMRFGKWWSGKSRKSHRMDELSRDSLGFLIDYARDYKRDNPSTDYILFGHMHYPARIEEGELRVLFLGEWDGDRAATYAQLNPNGEFELENF